MFKSDYLHYIKLVKRSICEKSLLFSLNFMTEKLLLNAQTYLILYFHVSLISRKLTIVIYGSFNIGHIFQDYFCKFFTIIKLDIEEIGRFKPQFH